MRSTTFKRAIAVGLITAFTIPLAAQPKRDPRVLELLAIRDGMTERARAVDLDELEAAYVAGDWDAVRDLLGYSESEADTIASRLDQLSAEILADYDADQGVECPRCRAPQDAFALIRRALTLEIDGGGGDEDRCDWGPLAIALALCTKLGPFAYWACAYVAYCEFCHGRTRDRYCAMIF